MVEDRSGDLVPESRGQGIIKLDCDEKSNTQVVTDNAQQSRSCVQRLCDYQPVPDGFINPLTIGSLRKKIVFPGILPVNEKEEAKKEDIGPVYRYRELESDKLAQQSGREGY
jgi:hypothetical protein